MPTSVNTRGSASGTTRSAVADGAITVRNGQTQTQNIADLSRDTDNANGHIDRIFDKDKVARKLEFAQGIQELGQRVAGDVSSYKMQEAKAEATERLLKANPQYASYSTAELNNLIVNDAGYKAVAEKWGTGGSYSMAAAAVTGVFSGLGAGNLGAAAAGGMAPYIANRIKHATSTFVDGHEQTNVLANTMAHAVAGAVLAQLAGNDAAAGAAGAAGGELMARAILATMYPKKQASELTQDEKEIVSALGQLAAQLSAGVASGSVEGGIQGAVAGKNAVENNLFGGTEEGQTKFVQQHGKDILSCADNPGGEVCQRGKAVDRALAAALAGGAAIAITPQIITVIKDVLSVTNKGTKSIDKIFEAGRTPKASELKNYAEAQGWKPSQTTDGPLKYVDENGINRVTIKKGSSRAPGSSDPHVEFKDATGQRTNAFGKPVTRKSLENHTSIDFDL